MNDLTVHDLTLANLRATAGAIYEASERFGDGGYAASIFLRGWDAAVAALQTPTSFESVAQLRQRITDEFIDSNEWSDARVARGLFHDGWDAAVKMLDESAAHQALTTLDVLAQIHSEPEGAPISWKHSAKNDLGEPIRVGDGVGRIDHYKSDGKVLAINRDRGYAYVLVRWPDLDDEWMHPGILTVAGPADS